MAWRARSARTHGNTLNLCYAYVYCAYEFSCEVTRTIIARTDLVARSAFYRRSFWNSFLWAVGVLFEKAHQLLKVLCRLEFTVVPSLKCWGRVPFRLPLKNSASLKFFVNVSTDLAILISRGKSLQTIGAEVVKVLKFGWDSSIPSLDRNLYVEF